MPKAIKSLGQNFIQNTDVINTMVDSLDIYDNTDIIEIGPGPGAITNALVKKINDSNVFYAVELDKRFYTKLSNTYKTSKKNINIVNANFLDYIKDFKSKNDVLIIGAIPYYITSPIIHNIIKADDKPKTIVLMIQKEVAQKLCEQKVHPNYFSTFIKTFYNIEYIKTVSRNDFIPVPKVDSAVIKMILKQSQYNIENIDKYQKFLHKGFKNQKKMLNKVFDEDILKLVKLDGTLRPHNLSLENWIDLYNIEKNNK